MTHVGRKRPQRIGTTELFLIVWHRVFAAVDEAAPALPIGSSELVNVGGGLIVVVLAIIVLDMRRATVGLT